MKTEIVKEDSLERKPPPEMRLVLVLVFGGFISPAIMGYGVPPQEGSRYHTRDISTTVSEEKVVSWKNWAGIYFSENPELIHAYISALYMSGLYIEV